MRDLRKNEAAERKRQLERARERAERKRQLERERVRAAKAAKLARQQREPGLDNNDDQLGDPGGRTENHDNGYTGPRCYAPGGRTWKPC